MVASERPRYSYLINAEDQLAWVSPSWLAFARENGAAQLTSEAVLGHCLWSYIADQRTQQLYQVLLRQIRRDQTRVVVPFRCDSPRLRRYMRLSIVFWGQGRVRFDGTLVRAESRDYLGVMDMTTDRSTQCLTMCSICQRTLIESIGWIDVEQAVGQLRLLEGDRYPQLRYSVCDRCAQTAMTN